MDAKLTDDKLTLRQRLAEARKALPAEERRERSNRIQTHVLADRLFDRAQAVALYAPMGSEVETEALARAAWGQGKRVAYPVVEGEGPLRFRVAHAGTPWETGPHGFRIPASTEELRLDQLDLVIVPGLGFDKRGHRLGRGQGHYDRTLAQPHKAATLGLAFDFQLVEALPADPWDVRLSAVATEGGLIRAQEPSGR